MYSLIKWIDVKDRLPDNDGSFCTMFMYEDGSDGGEYDENGKWIPNKQGLGLGHVFDELNKIYGEDFIKYK